MKFDPMRCPECGKVTAHSNDVVPGAALFTEPDDDGHVDYVGETKMFWDGQMNLAIDETKISLGCPAGHSWIATITEAN